MKNCNYKNLWSKYPLIKPARMDFVDLILTEVIFRFVAGYYQYWVIIWSRLILLLQDVSHVVSAETFASIYVTLACFFENPKFHHFKTRELVLYIQILMLESDLIKLKGIFSFIWSLLAQLSKAGWLHAILCRFVAFIFFTHLAK